MASSRALELTEPKKPDKPRAPKQPDDRIKDPAKLAAQKEAYGPARAEYEEKMREYKEVLYPAYEKEYQRFYNQSEQRKRKRQEKQEQQRAAKVEARRAPPRRTSPRPGSAHLARVHHRVGRARFLLAPPT